VSRRQQDLSLTDIERALHDACGITLSENIRGTLSDAVERAAGELGRSHAAFLADLRARDPAAVTALVEFAVIGETYFYRHPEQIDAISELLLSRAPLDAPLSIWSAGCATGEEPYSLAMALLDAGRVLVPDRVLATDVSARALAVAREGSYGDWSLRRLDPALCARHFDRRPPRLSVRPEVRRRVELRRHNLVREPPPPGAFDLVLCRNVLIYFTAPIARKVVASLLSVLKPGGLLALGPVEMPLADGLPLEPVEHAGAILLRHVPEAARTERRGRRSGADARQRLRSLRPLRPLRGDDVRAPRPAPAAVAPPAPEPKPVPRPAPAGDAAERPSLEAARAAARAGDLARAELLAREIATRELCPESWLLVSAAADARGDLAEAIDSARRALYLDPALAMAHAALVPLYARAGLAEEAARARRNALEAIDGLDDSTPLRGVEPITAGALRGALGSGGGGRVRARAAGGRDA
jgi:chemotaxis protein methyltransferase CheR